MNIFQYKFTDIYLKIYKIHDTQRKKTKSTNYDIWYLATRVYNILMYCVDLKKKMTKNNNIFLKINTNNWKIS